MTGAERHTANVSLFDICRKFTLAASRADHLVVEFSDRAVARMATPLNRRSAAERRFLQVVDEFKPELILLHFADRIGNRALVQARALAPGVTIADINIDSIDAAKNQRRLAMRKGVADALFVTTADPALGACAGPAAFAAYMPNPVDRAVESGRGFETLAPAFDVLLPVGGEETRQVGEELLSASEAVRRLAAAVPGLKVSTPGIGGQAAARGAGYFAALASARAGWSLSRRADLPLYSSDRMAHFFGWGLAVLLDRRPGFERFYGPDEAVFYDGLDDLAAAVRRLVADDAAARDLARRGWEKTWRLFDSGRVLAYVLAQLYDEGGARAYEWPCERWG